jgi:hypothetical protein
MNVFKPYALDMIQHLAPWVAISVAPPLAFRLASVDFNGALFADPDAPHFNASRF